MTKNLLPYVINRDSWRCGIFFSGNQGTSPRAKIFVLPKKFPADCDKPRVDVYNSTCHELVRATYTLLF